MITHFPKFGILTSALLALAFGLGEGRSADVTNWVVFNDYVPTPAGSPSPNGWSTAPRVNIYNLRGTPGQPPEPTAGPLTNYLTGEQLSASIVCTAEGSPDYIGAVSYPDAGTPAYDLFHGIVDLGNENSAIGVRSSAGTTTTITFTNLDPGKRYVFRGTSVRGGDYLDRWTLVTLQGADSFLDAHSSGVYTSATFSTGTLTPGQAAWNSGENRAAGAVVGWDDIRPGDDGSFSIRCQQYVDDPLPNGLSPALGNYGYALCGFMLAEVGPLAPIVIVTEPAPQTTVEENRPFSLTVKADGSVPSYQWYKDDVVIPGAIQKTYGVNTASLGDTGAYYVIVSGLLNKATSMVAQVTVNEDLVPPTLLSVVGSATFDRIFLQFDEVLDIGTAEDASHYSVEGGLSGLGVISATLTNHGTSVVLLTDPEDEDTGYTVNVDGVTDLKGNDSFGSLPFQSWLTTFGSGVLFEAFETFDLDQANPAGATLVSTLTGSPAFPDQPFSQENLAAFDTRLAFADDAHDFYGGRLRGLFIPPYSGQWRFFLRSEGRSQLFLNPTGTAASGKTMILEETGCCGEWGDLLSAAFPLEAGQGYYLEALYKAGSGGDFCKVAARIVEDGVPPSAASTAVDPAALGGTEVGFPAAPADVGGPLSIVEDPGNATVEANHRAVFSVTAGNPSDLPMSYQWRSNNVEIAGATGRTYSFQTTPNSTTGARFNVMVSKLGSTTVSSDAFLIVNPDLTPPAIVSASGSRNPYQVIVTFSEIMDPNSAGDGFSYLVAGFTVAGASLDSGGMVVTLTLNAPLVPGAAYQVTANEVMDLAGNPGTDTASFPAFVMSRGLAFEELYFDIGSGVFVADLTGSAKYPDAPDLTRYLSLLEGPHDAYDSYGTRITGWLLPPVSGNYTFYMASDEAGAFYLSTNASVENLALIAQETSYGNYRMWTGDRSGGTRGTPPSNVSTNPVPLEAGQAYAFMALAKEGTGEDHLGVTWQLPGGDVPPDGSAPISGAYIATLAESRGASITITQQPVNATVTGDAPLDASFTVGVSSTRNGLPNGAVTYQWQRDDGDGFDDIYGANARTYTGSFGESDNGAQFHCLVFIPGASVTSGEATLTVVTRPRFTIVYASGSVTVSWPLSATDYVLESTGSLIGDPVMWSMVPSKSYLTTADTYYIILPGPTDAMFFRLRQLTPP
jgi:Bacterial Ig-like domain/PA14 domain